MKLKFLLVCRWESRLWWLYWTESGQKVIVKFTSGEDRRSSCLKCSSDGLFMSKGSQLCFEDSRNRCVVCVDTRCYCWAWWFSWPAPSCFSSSPSHPSSGSGTSSTKRTKPPKSSNRGPTLGCCRPATKSTSWVSHSLTCQIGLARSIRGAFCHTTWLVA